MVIAIFAAWLALGSMPADLPTPASASDAPMEEVVVTGEHEGPRLWKVHKGDHVLWVLGTVTPLPKKLIWQSDSVEAVLQQSQEVVPAWPAFGIGANPFTALRVWIEWRSIQKIPDKMDLRQVLPPALYARFSALKARYAPKDSKLDELRPAFAAERLLDEALDATGLTVHNEVQQTVLRLARVNSDTTVIATVLWLGIYALVQSDIISFHDMARSMAGPDS